ncbi:MAG: sugar ABC transporter permease [Herpetosiphonaceae bacterium]|nr:sugar ABC transporter permease [Herpetosiphonaceae bacterium]
MPAVEKEALWPSIVRRFQQGNVGPLPVLIGLAMIALVFQIANDKFLTPVNLTNLTVQIASMGTISVGIVLVLLLGEVDLSVGAVSGLASAVMGVLSVKQGWPAGLAILAGIATGTLIGTLQGFWIAKFRVPSFVVSLAGLLAWQGALLYVLGTTGTVNLTDKTIIGIANSRVSIEAGFVIGIIAIVAYAAILIAEQRGRQAMNLPVQSTVMLAWRIGLIALVTVVTIGFMSINRNPNVEAAAVRGIPSAVVIFIAVLIIFDFITRRTRFGRYIYAVGGNVEAARRAGINVNGIRIAVFMLCSTLAACGGVLAASRLYASNQASGGGDTLLNAIAAAVIGGTSLFGGRGRVWSALLGALVIGAIANGMDLLAMSSAIKFMVTGTVLLIAVTLDASTRSRRENTGR